MVTCQGIGTSLASTVMLTSFDFTPSLHSLSSIPSIKMSDPTHAQATIESPALALRNIGLSSRDLMAAINRMGAGPETVSLASVESTIISSSNQETRAAGHVLVTFPYFGELPSELRIKIWSYICFHPRNVDIHTENLGTIRVCDDVHFNAYKFLSHFCSHPAILHVCREARGEGLKYYQLEFGTSHYFSIVNISTPPRIYVNFSCDRLCLLKPGCFGSDIEDRFHKFVQICKKHGAGSLALNVAQDQHWPFVDVATSWNALEELVLFGSAKKFEYEQNAVGIDFMKSQESGLCSRPEHKEEYIEEAAMRQLEIAKRDFFALFDMHKDGLQFDISFHNGITSAEANEKLLWKAPLVETCRLVIDGKPDANDWAWGG
jgi:hypothetical protein